MPSERVQRQIDRLLDEAEEAIASEDWTEVGTRARSVLRLEPENQDALSYLAASQRDIPSPTAQPTGDPRSQALPPTAAAVPEPEEAASRARLKQ